MRRRDLVALLGAAAVRGRLASAGRAGERVWRVGFLDRGSKAARRPMFDWFRPATADVHVLAYNLKRMIAIFGAGPLRAAIRT
jgi:hypothetical protein